MFDSSRSLHTAIPLPSSLRYAKFCGRHGYTYSLMGNFFKLGYAATMSSPVESIARNASASVSAIAPRIKFNRLDKTTGHIMQHMKSGLAVVPTFAYRGMTTMGSPVESIAHTASVSGIAPRIKFKRLDKTAGHIMQILDKEAVAEVRAQREIPEIKPGYIVQLKVVVPENKRRLSTIKGIVIARRNAGLNSTFRLRRLVAGVGVESLFPLYSPNIKEIKILDKKKVRRAKLYYLRDKMNALKKQ